MDVRLVIENGKKAGKSFRIKSEETVIGRKRDCDLSIASPDVSRRHCLLSVHKGCVSVEDLESVNGTYVNGKRVAAKMVVRPGDRLQVGPTRFVVEYEMTQETIDRMAREDGAVMAKIIEEPDQSAKGKPGRNLFAFDEKKKRRPQAADDIEEAELVPLDEDEGPLPFAEEIEESLHLPPNAQLRDILSEMSESPPKEKKRRKGDASESSKH